MMKSVNVPEYDLRPSCPINYDLDKCSSKEYGLSCETCCHGKHIGSDNTKVKGEH